MKCEARNLMLPRLERDSVKKLHSQVHEVDPAVRETTLRFIRRTTQRIVALNAKSSEAERVEAGLIEVARAAHPFVQSDCVGTERECGYLFIEFWAHKEKQRPFILALLRELRALPGQENLVIEQFDG